jgi:uncharacterized protein YhaN
MIIERIKIERFRCLRNFEAKLGPGLVVVRGPNESGKSTLMDAIVDALFTKPGSAKINDSISWGEDSLPDISLSVSVGDGIAGIEKDFVGKKVKITTPEKTITSAKAAKQWITSQVGCPSSNLFLATACVREEDIEIPRMQMKDSVSREIMARLQTMLTGGSGGSPAQVMQRLKKRLNAIDKKPGVADPDGGPARSCRMRLEESRKKLARLRQDMNASDLAAAELEKIRSREEELASELEAIKAALGNHRLCIQAEKNREVISERLAILTRAEQRLEELAGSEKSLGAYQGYKELEPMIERLKKIRAGREDMEKRLTDLSRGKYEREIEVPAAFFALIVTAALSALGGVVLSALLKSMWPAALGVAGMFVFGLPAFFLRYRAAAAERKRRVGFDSEIESVEAMLAGLEVETNEMVKKFGRVSVEDCLAAFQDYGAIAGEAEGLRKAVIDLAGTDAPREIERRISGLTAELRVEKDRIRDLAPYKISDPVSLSKLEREASRKEEERKALLKKKEGAQARMLAAGFDPGELIALEEEEAELEERLEYWERQVRVHDKALDLISEATRSVIEKAGEVIQKEIEPVIAEVTGGRYARVRADNELQLSLYSDERGDWVDEEELSLATREQLHIAARLALVRLITENKKPPIMLDDPFAHFDAQRLQSAMEVLKRFSEDHQIIVFSPTDRYDQHADRVIEL